MEQVELINEHNINNIYREYNEAVKIETKLKIIKDLSNKLSHNILNDTNRIIMQSLTNIFFEAPLKHPVKNAIIKILLKLNVYDSIAVDCLSWSISHAVLSQSDTKQSESLNETINLILCCFENFSIGLQSVSLNVNIIINLIHKSLHNYLEDLENTLSPQNQNQIIIFIHNAIRLLLSCFQQLTIVIKNLSSEMFDLIKNDIKLLLKNDSIPMDTKVNCGTINAFISKILLTFPYMLMELIFDTKLKTSNDKLYFCTGIINVMEFDDFSSERHGMHFVYKLVTNLIEIANTEQSEHNIILCVIRNLVLLLKNFNKFNTEMECNYDEQIIIRNMCNILLEYLWTNFEYNMDAVKYLCKELFCNIVKIAIANNISINEKILNYILLPETPKYTSITCINVLISLIESDILFDRISKSSINLFIHSDLLELSKAKTENKLNWYNKWIKPLIETINNSKVNDLNDDFILLQKLLNKHSDIIYMIIDDYRENEYATDSLIKFLSIARRAGTFDNRESDDKLWKNILSYTDMKKAILAFDDDISLSALKLIVDTHKSTEYFAKEELNIVIIFLRYNINCQDPSTRQQILAAIKKLLIRLNTVINILLKKINTKLLLNYIEFVQTLYDLCLENLFITANISRRTISLKILLQLIPLCKVLNKSELVIHKININNKENYQKILEWIKNESDENNKVICLDILRECPILSELTGDSITFDSVQKLATSIKPSDSITAAYCLEYLVCLQKQIPVNENNSTPVETLLFSEIYYALKWIMNLLDNALHLAKESLLKVCGEYPMYGLLFCMRHILLKINYENIKNNLLWREIIHSIIKQCKCLTEVVCPIVNNDSPEGHIPNNFNDNTTEIADNKITAQMVLLCAWRTIKEISLILGTIASKVPLINDDQYSGLLTSDKLIRIGAHFTTLLSETKHKGAFEQTYVGFCELCLRLWREKDPKLHTLPMIWLQELINVLSEDSSKETNNIKFNKICATRRSAGIPFMVQALVVTELKVNSSNGLKYCMDNLIKLSQFGETTEHRSHALNILRTLFRCSDLGDSISLYISDGIICSINGYASNTWAEKNSSALLFASLMIRIFGVQRTKDTESLNIRNKMTGRIFFLRYPKLYDFIYNELKFASDRILTGKYAPKLHPILIMLNRLYPSPLEGAATTLQLKNFIPFISICSGCREMYTRKLAAKSIIAILSSSLILKRAYNIIMHVKRNLNLINSIDKNSIHGAFLQIYYLLKFFINNKNLVKCNDEQIFIDLRNSLFDEKFLNLDDAILLQIYLKICALVKLRYPSIKSPNDEYHKWSIRCYNLLFCNINKNYFKSKHILGLSLLIKSLIIINIEKLFVGLNIIKINGKCGLEMCKTLLNIVLLTTNYDDRNILSEEYEIHDELQLIESYKIDLTNERIYYLYNLFEKNLTDHYSKVKLILFKSGAEYLSDSSSLLSIMDGLEEDDIPNDENLANFKSILRQVKRFKYPVQDFTFFRIHNITDNLRLIFAQIYYELLKQKNINMNIYALYLIIQMLNDDCNEIRYIGVQICRLYMDDKFMGNPLYMQNEFIKFLLHENNEIIIYFFAMDIITINNQEACPDNSEMVESRVFEKNDINLYREDVLLEKIFLNSVNGVKCDLNLPEINFNAEMKLKLKTYIEMISKRKII